MPTEAEFTDWFEGLELEYFSASEILSYFRRKHNSIPPKRLWDNAVKVLNIIDLLRGHFDKPIRITSSYRAPAYNDRVGGARRSQHLQFRALDIQVMGVTPKEVFRVLKNWRDDGVFEGGLGLYSRFTHIDTRGINKTW